MKKSLIIGISQSPPSKYEFLFVFLSLVCSQLRQHNSMIAMALSVFVCGWIHGPRIPNGQKQLRSFIKILQLLARAPRTIKQSGNKVNQFSFALLFMHVQPFGATAAAAA
jgi:hypothetical protein